MYIERSFHWYKFHWILHFATVALRLAGRRRWLKPPCATAWCGLGFQLPNGSVFPLARIDLTFIYSNPGVWLLEIIWLIFIKRWLSLASCVRSHTFAICELIFERLLWPQAHRFDSCMLLTSNYFVSAFCNLQDLCSTLGDGISIFYSHFHC